MAHQTRHAHQSLDWMKRAYCIGKAHLFFGGPEDQALARHKCKTACPVRGACEAYVLTEYGTNQPEGVWAGMGETERRRIVRKRQKLAREARKAQGAA